MANKHIPTSLRLMPRAFIWVDPIKICTEVFSNWRCRRRLSCLELGLRIIRYASENKVSAAIREGEGYGGSVAANLAWSVGEQGCHSEHSCECYREYFNSRPKQCHSHFGTAGDGKLIPQKFFSTAS